MRAELECLTCIARQALRAARLATDDPILQRHILNQTLLEIPGMDLSQSPAVLSRCAFRYAREIGGNPDPYRTLKREQNDAVLAMEQEMEAMIRCSDNPLLTSLKLAAAGNIIDLGIFTHHEIDVADSIRSTMNTPFAVDHTKLFVNELQDARTLLYFLDNAGEIVFDKLLIRELQRRVQVTVVVKGAPIINDVCREDAEQVGLDRVCKIMDTGEDFVGAPPALLPDALKSRMRTTDIILGKGQGNYETLDSYEGNVYLLLRAKCDVVAKHLGVSLGDAAFVSTRACAAQTKTR